MIKVKRKNKKILQQRGITLVALVISIIVLLILAGISIQALTNQGIFTQASKAKKETQRAQVTEWLNLKLMEEQMYNPTGTDEEIIETTRLASKGNAELAKMGKTVVVDENTSTIEDGEPVAIYFYVQVDDDVYKVEMAGAQFIGEKDKFPPVITIESITKTTNSITVKIKTSRNEEGTLEIYKKAENATEYTREKVATGEEAKGLEYTFLGLEQNKNYSIKIVATAKNEQLKEYTTEVTLGSVPDLTQEDITFTYKVDGQEINKETWTNKNVTVTASTTVTGYTLQTSTDGQTWSDATSQTFTTNGKIYAVLYDGKNYGGSVEENVTNIDIQDPQTSIQFSSTSPITSSTLPVQVNTNVIHSDNQSGINLSETNWVLNNNSEKIGTDKELYTEKFTGENDIITITLNGVGKFYLHVLSIDNAGNKVETISPEISVAKEFHLHTGDSTNGGGCYGYHIPVYHNHAYGCRKVCGKCGSQWNDKYFDRCPRCRNEEWYWSCGKSTSTIDYYSGWSMNCGKTEGVTVERYEVSF